MAAWRPSVAPSSARTWATIRADATIRDLAREQGPVVWLGVPLRGRDRVLGILAVLRGLERRFGPADIELLEAFADQAAVAIENPRLFERAAAAEALRELARTRPSSWARPRTSCALR
ncbi:MAG: GAF domain-containing protein [Chloroflexota bacterium]|nr:GAF domain-containing protein [Chloroflexota bacterium]